MPEHLGTYIGRGTSAYVGGDNGNVSLDANPIDSIKLEKKWFTQCHLLAHSTDA